MPFILVVAGAGDRTPDLLTPLNRAGYYPHPCGSAREALSVMHCIVADLLIVDAPANGTNARDVLALLRGEPRYRALPALVVGAGAGGGGACDNGNGDHPGVQGWLGRGEVLPWGVSGKLLVDRVRAYLQPPAGVESRGPAAPGNCPPPPRVPCTAGVMSVEI